LFFIGAPGIHARTQVQYDQSKVQGKVCETEATALTAGHFAEVNVVFMRADGVAGAEASMLVALV